MINVFFLIMMIVLIQHLANINFLIRQWTQGQDKSYKPQ